MFVNKTMQLLKCSRVWNVSVQVVSRRPNHAKPEAVEVTYKISQQLSNGLG